MITNIKTCPALAGFLMLRIEVKDCDHRVSSNVITKIKKNIKITLIPIRDKILLCHRAIIETGNDELKNISQIEHTRHRSQFGFFINLVSGLIAHIN